ncbi:hypothetical protein V8G54_033005 [Vigna mungo]|uniref:TLC domain-containing protein n=1 Tax=Vigna mungo TaxID=3915 RepID=A0AAQ3MMJ8_VIGMU
MSFLKVYRLTANLSSLLFAGYGKLNRAEKIEWNNRGFSTVHALFVSFASFYFLVLSDIFKKDSQEELVINRSSTFSNSVLGISIGYFLADLAMILWHFPALGGVEYVLHHGLSMFSIIQSLLSGQGQIYILMVLFSESTTPFVNLRWHLDVAGLKSSKLYVWNGAALFFGWLDRKVLRFWIKMQNSARVVGSGVYSKSAKSEFTNDLTHIVHVDFNGNNDSCSSVGSDDSDAMKVEAVVNTMMVITMTIVTMIMVMSCGHIGSSEHNDANNNDNGDNDNVSVDDDCNKGCDNSSTLVACVDGGCSDASKSSGDSGGCNLCAFSDQLRVNEIFPLGFYTLVVVPPVLTIMNLFWFWKIAKGLVKTLSKAKHGKRPVKLQQETMGVQEER